MWLPGMNMCPAAHPQLRKRSCRVIRKAITFCLLTIKRLPLWKQRGKRIRWQAMCRRRQRRIAKIRRAGMACGSQRESRWLTLRMGNAYISKTCCNRIPIMLNLQRCTRLRRCCSLSGRFRITALCRALKNAGCAIASTGQKLHLKKQLKMEKRKAWPYWLPAAVKHTSPAWPVIVF